MQVLYAYRPCDLAVLALEELRARNFDKSFFDTRRVLVDEIESGSDDLGILVMGEYHPCNHDDAPASAADCSPPQPQLYAHW